MRYTLIILLGVVFGVETSGQNLATKFYNERNQLTDSASSLYYRRGRSDGESGDTLISYYTSNGKMRDKAITKGGLRNGAYTSFFENGRVHEKGTYAGGNPVGYFMTWYPQGAPHKTESFSDKTGKTLVNYWDSTGLQTVKDGYGFCKCYDREIAKGLVKEVGKIAAGKRDSVWLGYINDSLRYKESYIQGDFKTGELLGADGKVSAKYDVLNEQPVFPGGLSALINYLRTTVKYPPDARRRGIGGNVLVEFVIDTDGSIQDATIAKGVSESLDREALRVITSMPKWVPGKERGQAVRVRYVLPISFKLG